MKQTQHHANGVFIMFKLLLFIVVAALLTACQNGLQIDYPKLRDDGSVSNPHRIKVPRGDQTRPPEPSSRPYRTGALVYQGVATAFGDAESIAGILQNLNISYEIWNSSQFNTASLEELSQFGMIV